MSDEPTTPDAPTTAADREPASEPPDRRGADDGHPHGDHGADGGHAHGDHGADGGHAHGDHAARFRDRFWWTTVLTVPIVAAAPMLQSWFGYSLRLPGEAWLVPILGTAVFLYGGWPFLTGGLQEARDRTPGMMSLIALAITVAYGASVTTALGWFDQEVWWELALLIAVMLLGHWVEMRAIGRARGALEALAELLPETAERLDDDGRPHEVPLAELRAGDTVLVRPGGRIPVDGEVTSGAADVDESMITGESTPVPREAGQPVVAGSVVTDASLRVRVTALGDDTTLAGIERMVAAAQSSRSRTQVLADRAAALLFYVAVAAGAVTAVVWSALGEPGLALDRTVTVLIIACPHALGLAIPLVTSISTSGAARAGVLVTDRLALERMREVDTVVFDKTGTLTHGSHVVTDLQVVAGRDEDEVLALAAAVEGDSEHPLARAIRGAADDRGLTVPEAHDFRVDTGRGVSATIDGRAVAVAGPAMVRDRHLDTRALDDVTATWREHGAAVLHVVEDDEVVGAMALADQVREVSAEAVAGLQEAGVRVVLLTGDATQVAEAVAGELGIDEVRAEVLPEDKDREVARLQEAGRVVAMVGDGVNDAPALARADVGIAIGAGTDVAVASAGIVLASDDPRGVLAVRRLSAATYRKMVQNLWWAAGYNLAAIPLAAGVLAPVGFVLPMALGAVAMSTSTVVVALNAQLLRRETSALSR